MFADSPLNFTGTTRPPTTSATYRLEPCLAEKINERSVALIDDNDNPFSAWIHETWLDRLSEYLCGTKGRDQDGLQLYGEHEESKRKCSPPEHATACF